ncbi:MAG: AarF/ABC1/UbiB kinase family protein [Alphaproteobacteria bacterium]|nr:AarF/ABC1/UbiB kinase family protein [Alphaproteobacteria bacterium]
MSDKPPKERSTVVGRVARIAKVGTSVGGAAARIAGAQMLGLSRDRKTEAATLAAALGGLKGPLMKVAQMLATVPDLLPPEYADALSGLQAHAPPMGAAFVRRRMSAELGPQWASRFQHFDLKAAAAASLGQVHKAAHLDGRALACKLQYPDMASAVEADLSQLKLIFAVQRRMDGSIDTREISTEIGARLREELDYLREAAHIRLYRHILRDHDTVSVPGIFEALSTHRLLTMDWLEGAPLLHYRMHALEDRNAIARTMFAAWWHPFSHYGVIHGDPHLGNYTVRPDLGINLLDFGCIRVFPASFVSGVIDLYRALLNGDRALAVAAYESWGFRNLSTELIETLNIWARFIYAPLLDDRVRTVADGVKPAEYGRREAFAVHQALRKLGPVKPPREFVFMDRAAIGLGAVFLHLGAELNFHTLFNSEIEGYDEAALRARQAEAFALARVPAPLG